MRPPPLDPPEVVDLVERLSESDRALLGQYVRDERVRSAQMEWDRWKRVAGTVCIGLRQTATDIEHLANRLDIDASQQRELLRHVTILRDSIDEFDGENWLKSPLAMQELRAKENGQS